MEFSIKATAPEKLKSDCVAVAVFAAAKLSAAAQALDRASKGKLSGILKQGDFDAKPGSTLMLYELAGVASKRVLLIGFGAQSKTAAKEFRDGVRGAVRAMAEAGLAEAALYVSDIAVKDRDAKWVTMQAAMAALENTYRFDRLKSNSHEHRKPLKRIILGLLRESRGAAAALERGIAIGEGVNLARDLGNLPPNICTPGYLAEQARVLGKIHKLKVTVLERREMEKLGMYLYASNFFHFVEFA